MPEEISITLPANLALEFKNALQEEGITPSEFVSAALKEYLFVRRFRMLRERMIKQVQAQGICADQDVFDRVS